MMEIYFETISRVGKMLRTGDVSSVALTELMLGRIETHNTRLNAFITVTADLARKQALQADAEQQGGHDRGPLHGIPIAIKDLVATRNIRTTCGSKLFEDWVPDYDATVVTRLADAGAVLLGKTGLHEFIFRRNLESLGAGSRSRRFQRRFGIGRFRGIGLYGDRHRYRMFHQATRPLLWHCRAQTDLWFGQ